MRATDFASRVAQTRNLGGGIVRAAVEGAGREVEEGSWTRRLGSTIHCCE